MTTKNNKPKPTKCLTEGIVTGYFVAIDCDHKDYPGKGALDLMVNSDISATDFALYVVMWKESFNLGNHDFYVLTKPISMKKWGAKIGVERRTAIKSVNSLEKTGLIAKFEKGLVKSPQRYILFKKAVHNPELYKSKVYRDVVLDNRVRNNSETPKPNHARKDNDDNKSKPMSHILGEISNGK